MLAEVPIDVLCSRVKSRFESCFNAADMNIINMEISWKETAFIKQQQKKSWQANSGLVGKYLLS